MFCLPVELLKEIFNHIDNGTKGNMRAVCYIYYVLIDRILFRVDRENIDCIIDNFDVKHDYHLIYSMTNDNNILSKISVLPSIYKLTIVDKPSNDNVLTEEEIQSYEKLYRCIANKNIKILDAVYYDDFIPKTVEEIYLKYFSLEKEVMLYVPLLGEFPTNILRHRGKEIRDGVYYVNLPNAHKISIKTLLYHNHQLYNIQSISFGNCTKLKQLKIENTCSPTINIIVPNICEIRLLQKTNPFI